MNVDKYLKLGLIDIIDPSIYSLGELIQLLNQHKFRVLLDVKLESQAYYQLKREEFQKSNRDLVINRMSAIEDIEHQNDEITHKIFIELGRNFITPFDREDIHSLASALDDAPQAFRDSNSLVGSPLGLRSGPGILPILARKDARLGLSPDLTGAFKVPPVSAL